MDCESVIEKREVCLGHFTEDCLDCIADEKNKQCQNYQPIILRYFIKIINRLF